MKYVICDDEQVQRDLLKKFLFEYAKVKKIDIEIIEYEDANNLWWDLQDGLVADLLLLDILMTDLSGIDLAKKMREEKLFHQICFISGIKDFVFDGYDVDAVSYILKPYDKDVLFKVLDKARRLVKASNDFSLIHTAKEIIKIYHRDLIGLEAYGHDTRIYLHPMAKSKVKIIPNMGITSLMKEMNLDLFQTHRSYAVNFANIVEVNRTECIGEDQTVFPIARGKYEACMREFIRQNRGKDA